MAKVKPAGDNEPVNQFGNSALYRYLEAAPDVDDDMNAYQCGAFREYFGFAANYIVDEDIILGKCLCVCCHLEQLRQCETTHTQCHEWCFLFFFLSLVVADITLLEESDQFKYLNRFATFTAGGGGGGALGNDVASLSLKIPKTPGFHDTTASDWARTNYALGQTVHTVQIAYDAVSGIECFGPDTVAAVCAVAKMAAIAAARAVLATAEQAYEFSVFTYDETFGVSEWALHDMTMKVDVLYGKCNVENSTWHGETKTPNRDFLTHVRD